MHSFGRTDTATGFGYSACLLHGRAMLDERRKRLKFRAWRRGFREIDLILGGFADKHASTLGEADIAAFERLLDARDLEVYDWIVGRAPAPPDQDSPLLDRLRAFRPDGPETR